MPTEALDWSREEVELVVADYLEMLAAYCAGQNVNKSERRRALLLRLNGRNDASVERKRSNISAIVEELGFHHLPGYKPLPNYQRLLKTVVTEQIAKSSWLDEAERAAAELPAIGVAAVSVDFSKVRTDAPRLAVAAKEPNLDFAPIRRDYVEREARNRSLGRAGEEFVVEHERWRLRELGEPSLAARVDWVATTRGDGLGYDVLSFDLDGSARHIEVKTTAFGIATPFFLTERELQFAEISERQFHIYCFTP